MTFTEANFTLPVRPDNSNKGTFGKVFIIGGCEQYLGAPILAGRAAYRVGCGLVRMFVPELIRNSGFTTLLEAVWNPVDLTNSEGVSTALASIDYLLDEKVVIVVGPGLSTEPPRDAFISGLFELINKNKICTVIDADALNICSKHIELIAELGADCVLTPHPGEMARLCRTDVSKVLNDRAGYVQEYSQRWNKTVILKGAWTLIASPGHDIVTVNIATSALAKAGTGDVLAGIVGGLMAQGLPGFEAAQSGCLIHACAALEARDNYGNPNAVMAGDVVEMIPAAVNHLRESDGLCYD